MSPFTSVQISTRVGAERRAEQRGGEVGPAAAQRRRYAVRRRTDEPLRHRDQAVLEQRAQTLARPGVEYLHVGSGAAEAVVGHHDRPDIDPGRGNPGGAHRAGHQPRAPELAVARELVELGRPEPPSERGRERGAECFGLCSHRFDGRFGSGQLSGDGFVPAYQSVDRAVERPRVARGYRGREGEQAVGDTRERRHHHQRPFRRPAGDDRDQPPDRRGIRHRGAAELADDHGR